jgi:hypothetical protein
MNRKDGPVSQVLLNETEEDGNLDRASTQPLVNAKLRDQFKKVVEEEKAVIEADQAVERRIKRK